MSQPQNLAAAFSALLNQTIKRHHPAYTPSPQIYALSKPEPPEPEPEPELYVGLEMRGYRSFIADWDGTVPILRPVHRGRLTPWVPGENTAVCYGGSGYTPDVKADFHGDPIPNPRCSCGFWAYMDADGPAHDVAQHLVAYPYASTLVTGVIHARGRTQQVELGFRSARAEIAALAPPRSVAPELLKLMSPTETERLRLYRELNRYNHSGLCPCLSCKAERGDPPAPDLATLAERYGVPFFSSYTDMTVAWPATHQSRFLTDPYFAPQYIPGRLNDLSTSEQVAEAGREVVRFYENNLRTRKGRWPVQPDFTGSSGTVVAKWWNWSLTKSTSDI